VLGDEAVRAPSLGDVEAGRGHALDALAEQAGHEQRVVSDVAAHGHLALGLEGRRPLVPRRLRLEQQVHDRLEPRHRHADGKELLGAGEPREQVAQVAGDRRVAERQIVEARLHRVIEEPPELHARMITNPGRGQLPGPSGARRIPRMADVSGARLPWTIVAGSLLTLGLLVYTLFVGYVPTKRRVASLEHELRQLYTREAELQTKVAQDEQRHALREQQLIAIGAERDALAHRLEELERQLSATRSPRR
jgi:hypothetical protein